ncbi:hypothetical protein C6501_15890 [Candidatus Poribacteria bacterium]|nr:MAG: hypothetical protein C6501_15890 [Candidatus Poribacteria bacterium]
MLKQRVFQIAVIFAAFMMLNLTVHSGEPCNRSTDVDSGVRPNTGAYGYAEVIEVGWYKRGNDYYANVTLWGYVENIMGPGTISAAILYDFRVIELTPNFNFKAQWYVAPIEVITAQLDPCESLMPSSYTNGLHLRGGDWLARKIVRAETMIKAEARAGKRGELVDEWVATGCVDKVFPRNE